MGKREGKKRSDSKFVVVSLGSFKDSVELVWTCSICGSFKCRYLVGTVVVNGGD